jgi:hypothetical protein
MDFLKGYKTVIFNTFIIIFAAIEAGTYSNVIPDQWEPLVIGIVGVVNIFLRAQTNTPIARKE